nr:DUF3037 domain-containing protein [Idiomarina sp. ATCH4]
MNTLCMYATVRFMPFAETQEFGNVGVVVCAPDTGKINFKLARKHFGRVNQFFEDLDGKLFGSALQLLEAELNRLKEFAIDKPGKATAALFQELTRHREGVIFFGGVSTAVVNNIDDKLIDLYEHYVERSFLSEKYRESIIEQNIRQLLKRENVKDFKAQVLETKLGEFKLPFVKKSANSTRVIRPLAFERKTPLAAYEHAAQWIDRLTRLQHEQIVLPHNMMLAVEKPTDKGFEEAYFEAVNIASQREIIVANANNSSKILNFANNA